MSMLYDRVMGGGRVLPGSESRVPWGLLADATVVNATNVADYFLSHPVSQRRKLRDSVPNLAPPIETLFIEAGSSKGVAAAEFQGEVLPEEEPRRIERLYSWGVLSHSYRWGDDDGSGRAFLWEIGQEGLSKYSGQIRWITRLWAFAEAEKKAPVGPLLHICLPVGADGKSLEDENGDSLTEISIDDREHSGKERGEFERLSPEDMDKLNPKERRKMLARLGRRRRQLQDDVQRLAYECDFALLAVDALDSLLLAISFMHCKNVAVSPVDPPTKLSRKYERKHGRPLTRYHVLEIEPMKRVLKTEGRSDEVGLKKALHIARGHFRTYSEEKPLFGKFAGTVWVPQHLRGSKDRGQVKKDYAVKSPGNPNT